GITIESARIRPLASRSGRSDWRSVSEQPLHQLHLVTPHTTRRAVPGVLRYAGRRSSARGNLSLHAGLVDAVGPQPARRDVPCRLQGDPIAEVERGAGGARRAVTEHQEHPVSDKDALAIGFLLTELFD